MFAIVPMEIEISSGEWICALLKRIEEASDGSIFLLPSEMHLHAFYVALELLATNKKFTTRLFFSQEFHDQPKPTSTQAR